MAESLAARTPDEIRAGLRERGWPAVFVKLTSGSSASCLALVTSNGEREHVLTTVEDTGAARFNTRKLRRLTERANIDRVLGFILGEGAIVERARCRRRSSAGRLVRSARVLAIPTERPRSS